VLPAVDPCSNQTLVTWEVQKLCIIGTLFDLKFYPVDVQALDVSSRST